MPEPPAFDAPPVIQAQAGEVPPVLPPTPPVLPPVEKFTQWFFKPIHLANCPGKRSFIFRILIQQFAVKIFLSIPVAVLVEEGPSKAQLDLFRDPLLAFIAVILVAPPLETLLLQSAPIELLRALRRSWTAQFLFGAVPFAALHFLDGVMSGVSAGIVGGLFFSYAYLECRAQSWWTAIWVTTAIHALHNLVVLPLAIAAAQ
ncbi:MAG: CPBP family glutamic-type intramembrane protease [Verrucomicrobiia bacterium]